MTTLFRTLLLTMIVLMAACNPNVPIVTPPPAAAPTDTAAMEPTAAPTDTSAPTAEPTAEPTSAAPAVDLSAYNLTAQVVESADQAWQMEAVRGEVTAKNPEAQDYNRIIAANRDGRRWVFEENTNHGLGEGLPDGFTFNTDGTYLYFYNTIAKDGCGEPLHGYLRRMDLSSGKVEAVEGFQREGRFFLSPYGTRAAEVVDSALVLTDLESGAQQSIAINLPFGGDVGYGSLIWSQDGQWLASNVVNNYANCNVRPELLDTLVVDVAAGSAKLLGSSANIAGAMRWVGPGMLLVQTGRETPASVDVRTGQSEDYAQDRDALMAKQAEAGLRAFLRGLYEGRFDPNRYAEVEKLFAGWELLTARYANMRFTGNAAMLQYACEQDKFRCNPLRQVVFTGSEPGSAENTTLYRFQVEFLDLEGGPGGPLVVNGQSVFDFTLEANFPELTQIYQLPPLEE